MGIRSSWKSLALTPRVLDALVPERLFERLSIASKLLLGFLLPGALTVIVAVYVLISLQRLNSLNQSIVKVDIAAQDAADKMVVALLAQDNYEKRYLILKSGEMRELFDSRGGEFLKQLSRLKGLPDRKGFPLEFIEGAHRSYNDLFRRERLLVERGETARARELSEREVKKVNDELIGTVKAMSAAARRSQDEKMRRMGSIGAGAFLTTLLLCAGSLFAGALAGLLVTRHIASSVHRLKVATEHISEGEFGYDPLIRTQDEIGALSQAFLAMGRRLRQLEEMYLDASPLTRLPGGIAIENVLKKRLESGRPVAFCMADLDNFKAFNDRYGYASGSEVIKETARLIEASVKAKGSPDDFIGHVGGDDFVFITTPEHARRVCEEVIARFDERIPGFYDRQDRERGCIFGKNRRGVETRFPIMTVSIAVVTNKSHKLFDPIQVAELAAELKDHAKSIPRSVYVEDRRTG